MPRSRRLYEADPGVESLGKSFETVQRRGHLNPALRTLCTALGPLLLMCITRKIQGVAALAGDWGIPQNKLLPLSRKEGGQGMVLGRLTPCWEGKDAYAFYRK